MWVVAAPLTKKGRCARITPQLCVDYMKALAADQYRWPRHSQQIRRLLKLAREEALGSLMFFFQAEDGIRALYVTGVQTCALPIWWRSRTSRRCARASMPSTSGSTA